MQQTPAGWYPDPWGGAPLRYWDGAAWTSYTAGGASPVATASADSMFVPQPTAKFGQTAMWLQAGSLLVSGIINLINSFVLPPFYHELFTRESLGPRPTPPAITQATNLISLPASIAAITGFAFIVIWMFRLTKNGRAQENNTGLGAGWAIGGWFIPIGNFFIPYLCISRALPDSLRAKTLRWWLAYMSPGVTSVLLIPGMLISYFAGSVALAVTASAISLGVTVVAIPFQLIWGLPLARTIEETQLGITAPTDALPTK
ncbi:MAG: DUF4328 domain-containing protein [Acidimicrobiia bacterium]